MPRSLSLLLVDDDPDRSGIAIAGLILAGHRLLNHLATTQALVERVTAARPDAIVVASDRVGGTIFDDLRRCGEIWPSPTIVFTDDPTPSAMASAIEAGVSAYVVRGLAPHRIGPIVDLGLARFVADRAMRKELAHARRSLDERRLVDRARALLMQSRELSEAQAYAALRKMAMDRGKRIGEVAKDLLAYAEALRN